MQPDRERNRYLAIEVQQAVKRREDRGQIDLGTNFLKALARITIRLNRTTPETVVAALDADEIELARGVFAYLAEWSADFKGELPPGQPTNSTLPHRTET